MFILAGLILRPDDSRLVGSLYGMTVNAVFGHIDLTASEPSHFTWSGVRIDLVREPDPLEIMRMVTPEGLRVVD